MSVVKYEEDCGNRDYQVDETQSFVDSPTTYSKGFAEPRLNLLDGTFFRYVAEKSTANSMVALCMKCFPQAVEVRGYGNCSSNFLSHLKRRHGEDTVEEYRAYIKSKKRKSWKNENREDSRNETTYNTLNRSFDPVVENTQNQKFDVLLTDFVIASMLPLHTIGSLRYLNIFPNFDSIDHDIDTVTQHRLEQNIIQRYITYKNNIKLELNDAYFVCPTITIWSSENAILFGIAAHWINRDLLKVSAPFACRCVKRKHYEVHKITQIIHEIFTEYSLTDYKIIGSVSGNSSNLMHEFKIFGVQLENIMMTENNQCLEGSLSFDSDDENDQQYSMVNNDILLLENSLHTKHFKCCAHMLNSALINALTTELNYSNNTWISNIHATTINKCNLLWKAAGQIHSSVIIEKELNAYLPRPNYTNWNSLFETLQFILNIKEKNVQLHMALNLRDPFTDTEFEYLREFLMCTAPIREALKILQSSKNSYYGIVMPCLFALKRNLLQIYQTTHLNYCKNLIRSYVNSISNEFAEFFNFNGETAQNAAFAALSYPRFKNQWLVCVDPIQRDDVLQAFKTVISQEFNIILTKESKISKSQEGENDFFNFACETENSKFNLQRSLNASKVKAEIQMLQFFAEETIDLNILNCYPEIKKVFIKYNTPLPSLTFGEYLFPNSIMSDFKNNYKHINCMSEKRILLNANNSYSVT